MLSSGSSSDAPLWSPPKVPLSTQRLASIANAFGIPIPSVRAPFARSPSEPGALHPRASPTPSAATSIPSSSKYLLHVIPPQCLYHESGKRGHRPPPPSANGYHPQFRRGVLVPVCANFQSQLALIAKEYALPSTTGMVLYLITSPKDSPDTATTIRNELANEPGPLLSEEIWKHVWTRIIRVEQMGDNVLSQSPRLYRLHSQSGADSAPQLRPLVSARTPRSMSVASSFSPSSTTSSTSDLRLNSKSPFMTSSPDPSSPDTLPSSVDDAAIKADRLVLPGLGSPSLVPILAKVEFDIDRRKAAWLEPWLRSRRVNHAKRYKTNHDGFSEPPLAFVTGTTASIDQEDAGYTPLSDGSDSEAESDAENATARVSLCTAANGLHGKKDEKLLNKTSRSQVSVIISSQETSKNPSHGVNTAEDELNVSASLEESENRVGTIFDDLDLPSVEFDDKDPYDKRKSHFLMKAKLDEIERAMLQCSPRALKSSLEEDSAIIRQSPSKYTYLTVSPSRDGSIRNNLEIATSTWPSVAHNSFKEPSPINSDDHVAPPQPILNGITTARTRTASPRAKEIFGLGEDNFQTIVAETGSTAMTDGLIPSSSDPFGRYSSTVMMEFSPVEVTYGAIADRIHPSTTTTVTSRFSLDSSDEAPKSNNRATLISKGIKKLWRRSDKNSQSNNQLPPVPGTRGSPNQLSLRPERSPKDILYTPGATSPVIADQLSVPSRLSPNFVGPSHLHFDQESPYPTRFSSRHSARSPSPPLPPLPEPQKTSKKSILKRGTGSRTGSVAQGASVAKSQASMDQSRPLPRNGIAENLHARQQNFVNLMLNKRISTLSTDIPPNPKVPEHLLSHSATPSPTTMLVAPQGQRTSDTNLPRSSTDSHASSGHQTSTHSRNSMTSSRDSCNTHPSFDTSQFEIVSPKAAALPYPFHGFDHD